MHCKWNNYPNSSTFNRTMLLSMIISARKQGHKIVSVRNPHTVQVQTRVEHSTKLDVFLLKNHVPPRSSNRMQPVSTSSMPLQIVDI